MHIDSLVRGTAGFTGKTVTGRVYAIQRSGAAAIIDQDGAQWIVYDPEVLEKPRPLSTRTDIPARLR